MDASVPRVLLSIALAALLPMASLNSHDGVARENIPHSRQKRILWITNDGRLALPPGTTMTITPSLSMPFVRHPPKGFLSNMTVSFPFTSKCRFLSFIFFKCTRFLTVLLCAKHRTGRLWLFMGESFVQQWTSFGWYDDTRF